ncbi:MAG: hypothetical protein HKN73_03565, partial [Gemmatimonadetes bacterium]|nr:hypothetical protein [Gemmatimonadota bacterium]
MIPATKYPRRLRTVARLRSLSLQLRAPLAAILVAVVIAAEPALEGRRIEAQVLPAVVGGVGGLLAGAYVTTGVFVLKSRATGWVMHSVETLIEPAPELLPLVAGPVAGALLGARSSGRLEAGAAWAGIGLASGAGLGALAGHLIWNSVEGRWAGGIIGSAAGLLVGSVVGAATHDEGGPEPPGIPPPT